MNESVFLEQLKKDHPRLKAWATSLRDDIGAGLRLKVDNLEYFYKVPPTIRLKEDASIITKAFHSKKNYADPYKDITDKVGLRFVLLTERDLDLVCEVIRNLPHTLISEDKDYNSDKEESPYLFAYQSMHFVVRPETERTVNSLLVDSGIACEIQVRTIMQHAYAELSHAVAYKPKFAGAIVPKSNRLLARSVALIETVDDNFIKVMDELSKINAPQNTIIQKLDALYRKNVGNDPYDKKLNGEVICSVLELLAPLAPEQIDTFLSTRPYVWDKIKQHKNAGEPFFQLPGILLLYYAASKFDSDILAKSFTFQDKLLGLFYTDQGIAHDL